MVKSEDFPIHEAGWNLIPQPGPAIDQKRPERLAQNVAQQSPTRAQKQDKEFEKVLSLVEFDFFPGHCLILPPIFD